MTKYCLDTNVFIEPWKRYYSPQFTKGYWKLLKQYGKKDIIFATMEVKNEITKIDDDLLQWVKTSDLFRDPDESVQTNLRKIMSKYPRLVDNARGRSMADPWVIAHAQSEDATVVTTVVTTEQKAPKKIKIPDVCEKENIPCIDIHDFVKKLRIEFTAKVKT